MKTSARHGQSATEWLLSFVGFIAVVTTFLVVGERAGMRVLGVMVIVQAAILAYRRWIPYGWEGREPSGHISGIAAFLLATLLGIVGVAMLAKPDFMLGLFGWG